MCARRRKPINPSRINGFGTGRGIEVSYDWSMHIDTPLTEVFRLKLPQARALAKLGIKGVHNLLYHFPARYEHAGIVKNIRDLVRGDEAVSYGRIRSLKVQKAFRKKIPFAEGRLHDGTGNIKVVWFNQPYIAKTFSEGSFVKITGTVSARKDDLYFSNPLIERAREHGADGDLFGTTIPEKAASRIPIYPESRGISSLWFFHAAQKILKSDMIDALEDPIPSEILQTYHLPGLATALRAIHFPKKEGDDIAARKRFSFEEIFMIQVARLFAKKEYEENPAFTIKVSQEDLTRFTKRFPFEFTGAQRKALADIVNDLSKGIPMSRLLEGDVGSGKTAVAAAAVYAVSTTRPLGQGFGHLQTAYMAPTEILARQHFESFIEFFKGTNVQIGLITGSVCRKFPSKVSPSGHTNISRTQILKWVASGEIPVVVGTHALIEKSVLFKHLALVIIDEQHRFGVRQRMKLARKNHELPDKKVPNLLSMTATPIPRTLALTVYGDLDLTLLDEMPAGRKRVITEVVEPAERDQAYQKIREELAQGRQAYVICPRIEEPDPKKELALRVKSAKKEAERLKKEVFPSYLVGLVHSKLKPSEKESVMKDFLDGAIHILVATSVVEVGVDVPNATTIVIEGAERFGLAQLHQLRGRVLRSTHQSYCFLFSDSPGINTQKRLAALASAKNGFELAELDLALRGEGSLSGGRQWGLSDVGMEAIKNIKMVEAARTEAKKIIKADPTLARYPLIRERIMGEKVDVHLE